MSGDRDRSGPRWISQHLAGEPTPRASELVEATPEDNVEGGGTVRVESTRTAPGDPVAVVHTTDDLEAHTDDDSHLDAEGELVEVEPVEPLEREGAEPSGDAPFGSPPVPLEGEPEIEPVDNGPGSEGSLDAGDGELPAATVTVDGREIPGEIGERPDDAAPGEQVVTATAGTPGSYTPDLVGTDRPGTLLELADRVDPDPDEAWPAGTWLPYGNGKRAHYGPDGAWHTGESPGYGTVGA